MGRSFKEAAREGLTGDEEKLPVQQDGFKAASREHLEEQERLARENQERQRIEQEQAEQDRLNNERQERERIEQEQAERDMLNNERQEQERRAQEEQEQQEIQRLEKIVSDILKSHSRLDEGQIKSIVTEALKQHLSDYVNLADLTSKEDFTALDIKHTSLHNEYEAIMPMILDVIGQVIEKLGELSHSKEG
jgi:hypothetical protein